MKAVHLTKVTARLERAKVVLQNARAMHHEDVARLVNIDVPDLIEAIREAKVEAEALRQQLVNVKEAGEKYSVTVWSDAPMRVSRIRVQPQE